MYNVTSACVGIRCRNLDAPLYGRVSLTGNDIRYRAHYECDYGYELVGNAYRRCLHNGYWSGREPKCVRKLVKKKKKKK